MPAPPIVNGQEFAACSIANGDGSTVTLFVTVINAAGDFTMRTVNTGSRPAAMTIVKAGGATIPVTIAAGDNVAIRRQDNAQTGSWFEVSARFSVQGAAR